VPPENAAQMHAHIEECPPCKDEWREFESTKLFLSTASQPVVPRVQSQAMWAACLEKLIVEVETSRREKAAAPRSWFSGQPRWTWAALGGAMAVFAGVWMLAPRAETLPVETTADLRNFQVVSFQKPSRAVSPFVDRHAAMSFDGFNDHVGSTLVSYSATTQNPSSEVRSSAP